MPKQNRTTPDPFRSVDRASPKQSGGLCEVTIDRAALASVVGGRITPRKGMDPAVVQGVTNLAKTIAEVGQIMSAKKQQSDAQMGQVMQRMMQSRGAR